MAKISEVKAYEILDSRGNPTVKAQVFLGNGKSGDAGVPSGASTGTHEALELRDGDKRRFHGMGVLKAIANIENAIAPKLVGLNPQDQEKIDNILIELDGTPNKRNLGANAMLAVSLACCRAAAYSAGINLYKHIAVLYGKDVNDFRITPMFNIINGGLHGCGKFNFQEFMIIPHPGMPYDKSYRLAAEVYHSLKKFLKGRNFIYSVGDEGGFTPQFETNEEVMEAIIEAINAAGYTYTKDVFLGMDFASSSFYQDGKYALTKNGETLAEKEFIDYLVKLQKKFDLFSLEDPLFEDSWGGWQILTQKLDKTSIIIGDDLLVTNRERLEKAITTKACNGIIIKPNQIGTLTETLEVIKLARKADFKIIISHRSGETNDDFIADLAVGTGADFAKFGSCARGERVIKYNRLLWLYYKLSGKV